MQQVYIIFFINTFKLIFFLLSFDTLQVLMFIWPTVWFQSFVCFIILSFVFVLAKVGIICSTNELQCYKTFGKTVRLIFIVVSLSESAGNCHVWRHKLRQNPPPFYRFPFPLILSSLLLRRIFMTLHMTLSSPFTNSLYSILIGWFKLALSKI